MPIADITLLAGNRMRSQPIKGGMIRQNQALMFTEFVELELAVGLTVAVVVASFASPSFDVVFDD